MVAYFNTRISSKKSSIELYAITSYKGKVPKLI